MVLTVALALSCFVPLGVALLYARRDDEWASISERERVSRALAVSTTGAARAGYGKNLRLPASVVESSSGYAVLAADGRPVVLTSIPAKADRPTPLPRMAMASRDAAGTFST